MGDNFELNPGETSIEVTKGDLWVGWTLFASQKRGKYTFTDQRVIFKPTQLLALGSDIAFDYSDIACIEKCTIGPMLPFGIKVTTKQGNKYKLSLMKRDYWIHFMQERMA